MRLKLLQPREEENGQALTEFALMLPIVLVLVFGLIFISALFYSYLTLQFAVREGAHTIVTDGKDQTVQTITALVQNNAFALNQVNVGITPNDNTLWTLPRIQITVVATYTLPFTQLNIPLPGNAPVGLRPITIGAQSNMWTQ